MCTRSDAPNAFGNDLSLLAAFVPSVLHLHSIDVSCVHKHCLCGTTLMLQQLQPHPVADTM